MFKRPFLILVTAIGCGLATTETVQAFAVNGGFETGNYSDWQTIGQTTVEGSGFGVTPVEGTYQAVLETLQDTLPGASGSDLETFLGLNSGDLTNLNVVEGSAIKQDITVNAGDVLVFSWNFLTDQNPPDSTYNDFAFFTLSTTSTTLADTFSPLMTSFSRLSYEYQTGYQPYSYTFATGGTYTLGFGVVDVGDDTVNSALLVDRISTQAIPEPLTILGSATAIGFGAWFKRRLKKD
jgi:hypothetical protein